LSVEPNDPIYPLCVSRPGATNQAGYVMIQHKNLLILSFQIPLSLFKLLFSEKIP